MLKALEKNRERRYASAADLAQDIRRHLSGEPIEAHPPTAWTRAIRWAGRRPAMTTTLGCLTIAAVFLIVIYTGVYVVNRRPWKIELTDDRREARVLAISGAILHKWTCGPTGEITFAELVSRPAKLGGKLAVLGFSRTALTFPGKLCAFSAEHDRDSPAWSSAITLDDIPRQLVARGWDEERRFGVEGAYVFEIFPEHPDDEIVVVYSCTFSARLIRIYDLCGQVLYQVWHDGALVSCYWMSQPRLLLFAGLNSEANWAARGHPEVKDPHAPVVFAIRPSLGFISNQYLRSTASSHPSDPLSPSWYRRLLPPSARDVFGRPELSPPETGDPGSRAHVLVEAIRDRACGVGWDIDETGQRVPNTLVMSDAYRGDPTLPDPDRKQDSLDLGDLPPVVTSTTSAGGSADSKPRP